MTILIRAGGLVLSAFLCFCATFASAQLPRVKGGCVDVALVLALDASDSVDTNRWLLQVKGHEKAFRSDEVLKAIKSGPCGSILVTLMQWSNPYEQRQTVGWTTVSDADSAHAFADRVLWMPRQLQGSTSISEAIGYATFLFAKRRLMNMRMVIDISGDGANNSGGDPQFARNTAIERGIVINGLPIPGSEAGVVAYYRNHVIAGQGSFVQEAKGFDDFEEALKKKLIREIATSSLIRR